MSCPSCKIDVKTAIDRVDGADVAVDLPDIISWHDNTSANKNNPDANTWLGFGPRSIDDMSFAWVTLTYLDQADFDQRVAARQAAKTTQDQ